MTPIAGMFDITLAAALGSFSVSMAIVLTERWHGKHSLDKDVTGVQKFHKIPVPRIGGVALVAGFLVTSILGAAGFPHFAQQADTSGFLILLLAGMPAFLMGLAEDLTKKISVRARLTATLASALLACLMAEAYLPRLDIWGFDSLLKLAPFAIIVTSFCVAGVANSINIIDGFHGLAGGATVIILAAMAYLCWESHDFFVMKLALVGIGATLGFLWVNYPTGRLFLGDGGAYFIGFWVAEVAVLTVARNPEISAWRVLAICAYPVIEVLYSIYRRTVIRKSSAGAPDRLHLHTLIYRRVVCLTLPRDGNTWIRNAAVACIVAAWMATVSLLAVWIGNALPAAVALVSLQVVLYVIVYKRLVRGRWCLNPALYIGMRPTTRSKSA